MPSVVVSETGVLWGPLWLVSGGGVQSAMAMSLHLFDGELPFFRVSSRVKST